MPVVDAWMQHPTLRHSNHEMFASLRRWTGLKTLEEELPLEVTLAALAAAGVDTALASAWYGPEGALITNDEVAAFVARSDGRLRGVAGADLTRPVAAVRELRRAVQELDFVALRIIPWLWQLPPTDRLYYPLYTACAELGVPFCTQVGHTGPLRPSETGRPIPYIDQVALDFPELTIVCGHIGYPWTTEMIAVADKHENVYIDTSAYTARRYPPELVAYLRGRGRRKVLFGSNYPMIEPSRALEHLGELGLDEETTELFLSGNARRVFRLGDHSGMLEP
ncbi:amidohydrolase family protein [Streptomyces aureus]|uniref:amidohydrolase family protein n=1 Tax=Streptomyces aureus TaxID=193461 RepID=UPI0036A434D6